MPLLNEIALIVMDLTTLGLVGKVTNRLAHLFPPSFDTRFFP